jgi:hypothetical protein
MALDHRYSRRCWCDACRLEAKHRLAVNAVWYFGTLLFLMIAGIITITVLAIEGVIPW